MLKPKNLLLFLFFFASYSFLFAADTLTITTYYPSPYGVYSRLRLSPHNDTDPTASCANHAGEIYYDDSDNRLYVCNGTNWQSVGGGNGWLLTGNAGTEAGTNFVGTINNAAWIVKTASAERMRIAANGKVGIGETSPNSKLEIKPPGGSEQAIDSSGTCLAGAVWPFTPCRGYALRGSVFGDGIATGIGVYGKGDYGVQGDTLEGGVGVYGAGAIGVQGGQPGSLGVADFIATESGYYGNTSGPSTLNDLDGDGIVDNGDYWFYPGSTCSFGSVSSIRWKKNIRPINNALEKILKLRGVYFNWGKEHGSKHDFGMIAEEVGKLFPEAVVYETDSKYATGMDYSRLTAVLVEAVKDMQKEIDSLKSEISEIDALANPK